MEEKVIFKGKPSQLANLGFYIFCLLLLPVFGIVVETLLILYEVSIFDTFISSLILIPTVGLGIILFLVRFFQTMVTKFELTDERIIEQTGVLSRRTDETELYRVKDIRLEEPLLLRMFGLSTIVLVTSDKTSPIIKLRGVKNGNDLRKLIRDAVEVRRDKKGVKDRDIQ